MQAPPDWYPDPSDAALQRYWDGQRWTEHTASYQREQVLEPQAVQYSQWAGPQPRDNRLVIGGWIAAVFGLLTSQAEGVIGFILPLLAAVFGVLLLRNDNQRQGILILAVASAALILNLLSR